MFNPNLMIAPDVGGKIAQGFEEGRQAGMQNKARAAMAALVRDPDNAGALEALAEVDPEAAMQFQQRKQQQALAGLEAHREKIIMGAQLVRQMQPKDQAGWDRVRMTAQQMGIDVSDVPPEYNEQYISSLVSVADAFKPRQGDDGRIVTLQPGGSAGLYKDGQMIPLVIPNDGTKPVGAPAGGGVQEGATATNPATGEKIVFRGGQWQPIGGSTPPASGNFPQ